jgi:hypothetical protein
MTIDTQGLPLAGSLKAYRCVALNLRTGHPCRTILIEAWSPSGAWVKRRCKQCGSWQTIRVEAAEPSTAGAEGSAEPGRPPLPS